MKFTNGIWFNKENTEIYNAVEVSSTSSPSEGEIRALCTTKHVKHRGDTLNKPTITLKLSSPSPNIIAGHAWHFRGAKQTEPRFGLFPDNGDSSSVVQESVQVVTDDQRNTVKIQSGDAVAELNKNSSAFRIAYHSSKGRYLTDLGFESLQYIISPPNQDVPSPLTASTTIGDPYYRGPQSRSRKPYMSLSFGLQVGEKVYGLGERFGPFVKNGQEIDLWNEDAGTCAPYTYKNIPFYMTNRGYGIFFDHSDVLSLEIQNEKLAKVQVSIQSEEIRWCVIYGPSPKEILSRYADMTGHPPIPPAWSFGLYLSTSFLTDYDEKTVTTQLDGMKDRDIPMSVLHFDCFWMKGHEWTNFTFDPIYFPDPKAFLGRLHQRGLKVCVWINSYIAQESEAFTEAMDGGYLIKRCDGSVWQSDIWQAGMGIVDFTNPKAVEWYQEHLEHLLDIGVDSFKTDFGERIPWEDVRFHDGMDPRAGHNYYSFLYNKTVYDAIVRKRGVNEAVLFARAATAGGQQFPVHWGGDCECTWAGMSQSLRGGLSLGMSGFGFWSHDIGGFMSEGQAETTPAAALYKRWVQFGMLSSHSRLHGSRTYRVPWLVDDESSDVLKKFSQLKNRLMPYLFAQAIQCQKSGLPLLRAMVIEFPDDITCQTLDEQYMLGDSLLVAPIFNGEGVVDYYLPSGRWMNILDGTVHNGPGWIHGEFDYMTLPLLLRADRVLLLGSGNRPDYAWESNIEQVVIGHVRDTFKDKTIDVEVPDSQNIGSFASPIQVKVENLGSNSFSITERGQSGSAKLLVLDEKNHL